ncbi:MAG TPA: VCBS repeat-containing protein, partial [Polyangia bacterium]
MFARLSVACVAMACLAAVGCSAARLPVGVADRPESVAACARADDGVWCARWVRGRFEAATRWSADFGYASAAPGSDDVLRTPDLDGDGLTDVCLRTAAGLACALRVTPSSFGPALQSRAFADVDGFGEWSAASTLAFVDVDGDGKLDACARRGARLSCAHGRGDGRFDAARVWLIDLFGDGEDPLRLATTRFGDVNGDGLVDVCVNGRAGVSCALSLGDQFAMPS